MDVDEHLRPGHHACAAALRAAVPDRVAPAILHADGRLGNMLCQASRVAAASDWEIWSVGDPRIDLAWFLAHNETATMPLILKHNRRRPDPDAAFEAQAPLLPRLLWVAAHAG